MPLVPQVVLLLPAAQVPESVSQHAPLHSPSLVQKRPHSPSRHAWPAEHPLEAVHCVLTQLVPLQAWPVGQPAAIGQFNKQTLSTQVAPVAQTKSSVHALPIATIFLE